MVNTQKNPVYSVFLGARAFAGKPITCKNSDTIPAPLLCYAVAVSPYTVYRRLKLQYDNTNMVQL